MSGPSATPVTTFWRLAGMTYLQVRIMLSMYDMYVSAIGTFTLYILFHSTKFEQLFFLTVRYF